MLLYDDAYSNFFKEDIGSALTCNESQFFIEHYDYIVRIFPASRHLLNKYNFLEE